MAAVDKLDRIDGTNPPVDVPASWHTVPPEHLWLHIAWQHRQAETSTRCLCCGHPHPCRTRDRMVTYLRQTSRSPS